MVGMHQRTDNIHPVPAAATPDLTGYRDLHRALLVSAERLTERLGQPDLGRRSRRALQRWFAGYRDELRHHHHVEDHVFFPALAQRVPSYQEYSATLDSDHIELDTLIDRLGSAIHDVASGDESGDGPRVVALGLAVELRDHLADHLAFENDDILPMFERHLTVDEYAELERRALQGVSLRQAWFTVPWYMSTVDSNTARATWADAPIAMKIMHVLSRRSHARLSARALGVRS
jgi:iron-sulfur cluster repair protein YtfE (RIC family)